MIKNHFLYVKVLAFTQTDRKNAFLFKCSLMVRPLKVKGKYGVFKGVQKLITSNFSRKWCQIVQLPITIKKKNTVPCSIMSILFYIHVYKMNWELAMATLTFFVIAQLNISGSANYSHVIIFFFQFLIRQFDTGLQET